MASTAIPQGQGSLRQRNAAGSKKKSVIPTADDAELDSLVKANKQATGPGSEWDYKLALTIITILAFVSRFWGISHPNEVVFDEVHFGKVRRGRPRSSLITMRHCN